jgi:BirA family biotin operon repressor/biotin-[acetyl-CoA-carboxylase] ligase
MAYFNLIKLNATSSTNNYIKEKRSKGACKDGDLVWTKHQTSGRGQSDKSWQSEANKSLSLTIYKTFEKESPKHPFEISCAVACAIIRTLHSIGIPELNIKWPNDILSCNHKIGGILIENTYKYSRLNETIIGLGLNINQEKFDSLPHARSLFMITKRKWDIETVLNSLIQSFENVLISDLSNHLKANLSEFNLSLWRKKKPSKFYGSEGIFEAIPLEVTQEGNLLISDLEGAIERTINLNQARMLYSKETILRSPV